MSFTKGIFIVIMFLMVFAMGFLGRTVGAVPEHRISSGINIDSEPVQRSAYPFTVVLGGKDISAKAESDTAYSIDAKVESIKKYDDDLSSIIPYDALLSWGKMSDKEIDGNFLWEQYSRRGTVSGSLTSVDISSVYLISHVSNTHLIPANSQVLHDVGEIEAGDYVHIEGLLMDLNVYSDDPDMKPIIKSSKSRSDQGDGACEIIYVQSIKISK